MIAFFESLSGVLRFASITYLLFLAVTVVVYFMLPGRRTRAVFLLLVSTAFYLTLAPRAFGFLAAVTLGTYLVGLALDSGPDGSPRLTAPLRRIVAAAGVVGVVGTLVACKYVAFRVGLTPPPIVDPNTPATAAIVRFVLPLGVSFWSFQAIAYVVDVYRGKYEAVRNPLMYALAVSFFPIVTSGPITRVQALTEQLDRKHAFDYGSMQSGLLLIAVGFFKKLMIADRLAVFVNTVFDNPHNYTADSNGLVLLVAAVFFSIQLYCDFSGYTDIVRGSARLFGVELPINFRAPYFARSVQEFWRRWHITLMDWLREFIYIPLGGNRKGKVRQYVNVMAVFLISGLWHGVGLTYLVWGGLNGLYSVAGRLTEPIRDRVVGLLRIERDTFAHRLFQTLLTFGLITVAWVFFRANSISDALYIVSHMVSPSVWVFSDQSLVNQGLTYSQLLLTLVSIAALGVVEWMALSRDMLTLFNKQHLLFRWTVYYALIAAIVVFGHYGGTYSASDFVYFKF